MDGLKVLLWIVDPLLVAFMVSVFIGVGFKKAAGNLMFKRCFTFLAWFLYMLLYVYADRIWNNDVIRYIVMFAPLGLFVLVFIISLIVAPKDKIEDGEMEKEFETKKFFTGWDSMYPNDLDNYDKRKK